MLRSKARRRRNSSRETLSRLTLGHRTDRSGHLVLSHFSFQIISD
jgi:hypothetical protein